MAQWVKVLVAKSADPSSNTENTWCHMRERACTHTDTHWHTWVFIHTQNKHVIKNLISFYWCVLEDIQVCVCV